MDRRRFLLTSLAGALAAPIAAEAQPAGAVPRIGILAGQSSSDLLRDLGQFRQELRKLGWIEGRTITVLAPRSSEVARRQRPYLAS